jgi:hypothetical protein
MLLGGGLRQGQLTDYWTIIFWQNAGDNSRLCLLTWLAWNNNRLFRMYADVNSIYINCSSS